MELETSLIYVYLDKPYKRGRGALGWIGCMTLLTWSGWKTLMAVTDGCDSIFLFVLYLLLFVIGVIWGGANVAGNDSNHGSVPISVFDSNYLYKGKISTRRHESYQTVERANKSITGRTLGYTYVFFTSTPAEVKKLDISSFVGYTLTPVMSGEVPETELWVDYRNKRVHVNPETWNKMKVYRIYRHVYED
ncbi:MAG: hypothetical protein NC131_17250 [Roseburia sp.]|nr:hypothetical protein [Roseburia sp.]